MDNIPGVEISETLLAERREALDLTEADRARLRALRPAVEAYWPALLAQLYQRLQSHAETEILLRRPETIQRLIRHQTRYLGSLFESGHDLQHARDLLHLGFIHYRLRVTPQWYIATYSHMLCDHVDLILADDSGSGRLLPEMLALVKSVFYDAALVLDAYGVGHVADLRERRAQFLGAQPARGDDPAPAMAGTKSAAAHVAPTFTQVRLTGDEVAERASFIGLTQADSIALRELQASFAERAPGMLDDFYNFITRHPETAALVPEAILGRLKRQVASYWQELITSDFSRTYAASRMRVGVMHERIGLSLQWYLGSLARQLVALLDPTRVASASAAQVKALIRAVFFDLTFVIDAYMDARAEALMRADGYANELISGLSSAVAVLDQEQRVVSANPALVDLLPGAAALLYRMPIRTAIPIPEVAAVIDRVSAQGQSRAVAHGQLGARKLRLTAMRLAARPDMPQGGLALVIDDISELLRLSHDASDADQHLAQLVQSVDAVLWRIDRESRVVQAISAPVLKLTGYRDVYFLGRSDAWLGIVPEQDRARILQRLERLAPGASCSFDHRIRHADGSLRWVRCHARLVAGADSTSAWHGVMTDITDLRRSEAMRLDAVGMLAGGTAHVLNNSFMAITGSLELQARDLGGAQAAPRIRDAMDELRRASQVTAGLLAFGGRQPLRPERSDVNAIVAHTLKEIGDSLTGSCRVEFTAAPGLWPVALDPAALGAALWCLARNAQEAMARPGTLRIRTANVGGSAPDIDDFGLGADWIEIEVADDGSGMPETVRARAFEPFFTTRHADDSHHGLGLSMVYGFVVQSGGYLALTSSEGRGTTVRLRFPRLAQQTDAPAPPASRAPSVLVVEDHALVRDVVRSLVESLGYVAIDAPSGAEALALLEKRRFDVLLTDIRLGAGVDGVQLAKLAQARYPAIRVVLMSGFSADNVNLGDLPANYQFLYKPFTPAHLEKMLASVIIGLELS